MIWAKLLLRRVSFFIFLVLLFTLFSLLLENYREGSFVYDLAGQRSSPEELQTLLLREGQSKGLWERFWQRSTSILSFNFGNTLRGEPILPLVWEASQLTLALSFVAAIFSFLYGYGCYVVASFWEKANTYLIRLNYFILSTPIFVLALLFLWLFSLKWGFFPPGGTKGLWYILPSFTLALKSGGRLALFYMEYRDVEESKGYVTTARAFGLSPYRIYLVHVFKNIFLPAVSFWLIDFSTYMAGAAIVESLFALPGLGSLLISAFYQYDTALMTACLVVASFFVYLTNLVAELLQNYYSRFYHKAESVF
ncbi:MAG: ABC transporter permease [Leptospiraceae bacterium]|nr:ABC transporter permease [Leptospiraceae bacterium]MDW8306622.1 ABC transporter permease [Leptospiraceae bacterium]